VGARGAEWFFRARGDTLRAARAAARWADDRVLAAFWGALYRELDSLFAAHPGDSLRAQRLALRDSTYRRARATLSTDVAQSLRTINPLYTERVALDNAALLARRVYLTDLERFERTFAARDSSLVAALDVLIADHLAGRR
jgi:hypothetical protein